MDERKIAIVERVLFSRLVKLGLSTLVFVLSACRNAIQQLMDRKPRGECTILYYHRIYPEHRQKFARQMDVLLRTRTPVSVNRREALSPKEKYVAVTFDDGYISVAEQALPELILRNIPATIFVTSDRLGETPEWKGYAERFMSIEELRKLPQELISLGSHTRTHPLLVHLSEEEARDEIDYSRRKLSELLSRNIALFSFPHGAFNERLVSMCREAGYERVFTTLPYQAMLGPEEFVSGRVSVEPTDWPIEFYLKITGAYRWLPAAFAVKKKMKDLMKKKSIPGRSPRTA